MHHCWISVLFPFPKKNATVNIQQPGRSGVNYFTHKQTLANHNRGNLHIELFKGVVEPFLILRVSDRVNLCIK